MSEKINSLEINPEILTKLEEMKIQKDGNIEDVIVKILEINNKYKNELEEITHKYNQYRSREIDAFEIGNVISDGICVVDKHGIIIQINTGYTKITGLEESEIIGNHMQVLLDKGYFSKAVSLMVLEQKKKISAMSTITNNNKKVLITGNPYFDEKGNVTQVLTVMRDLTELLELQQKLEKTEKESIKYLSELEIIRKKESNLLGNSQSIQDIKILIESVAVTDATVLITGETGVGKEVVAGEIYQRSLRNKKPYIKVNCAAIPENLLESELFGYEKGAFTGADKKQKIGLFEIADKGTILLDEIGEMPILLQSKLLRVLQEKEITRVGGTQPISLDVRVIAATNRNLLEKIEQGHFREDLYYRLNVIPIYIPPLRERKGDIPLLTHMMIKKFNKKYNKEINFDESAIHTLQNYDWLGNVRELMNIVERLLIVNTSNTITQNDIVELLGLDQIHGNVDSKNLELKKQLYYFEKRIIEKVLKEQGSTYKAAKILGISQPTVVRKAKSLGISNW
ncbi:PAS domain S-box protein [Alkalibaculum sp. M08DMB]|uniref:HTH-type transcriptional regulatory protein TyrR n=1 Tax=Alkalibaculum sporogenes TaxID=2655001 RepID=A0A6A7K5N4_9FIRM|nr:sigma 54-interacting transcriptional regulator [Alkalibaculum sporogenes]MPW24710.1 PAS domain S-box protein [Alkalibaculum sporogenes]